MELKQIKSLSEKEIKSINNRIKKEKNRLKKLYLDMDENVKKMAEDIIENVAYMSITLQDLRKYSVENGIKELYMNGKGQFGYKESVESKNYNLMIKNYLTIVKQLTDLLPNDTQKKKKYKDEFDKFNDIEG